MVGYKKEQTVIDELIYSLSSNFTGLNNFFIQY